MANISITQAGRDTYFLLCSACKHTGNAITIKGITGDAALHVSTYHNDGRKHRVTMDLAHATGLIEQSHADGYEEARQNFDTGA